jgi:hypothetical protein
MLRASKDREGVFGLTGGKELMEEEKKGFTQIVAD